MFRKASFRAMKDTAAAPEPATVPTSRPVSMVKAPQQAPSAPTKPVEVAKPKPAAPASIIPPGTTRVLVVGKAVVMTADVDSCDAVIVQGNLDGDIKAKYVVIMKGGCMRGRVECDEADVAGSFEGMEMIAHNRLTLSGTARVGGKTTYHCLSVHDGAVLTGELLHKPAMRSEPKPEPVPVLPDLGVQAAAEVAEGGTLKAVSDGASSPEKTKAQGDKSAR